MAEGVHEIPDWMDCGDAVNARTATALHRFVYDNEPAGGADEFREGLAAVLRDVLTDAHNRIFDLLLGDDGQAHKEAVRYLKRAAPDLHARLSGSEALATLAHPTDSARLVDHAAHLSIALREDDKDVAVESWRSLPQHLQRAIDDREAVIAAELAGSNDG